MSVRHYEGSTRIETIDGQPTRHSVSVPSGKCWCAHAPSDHIFGAICKRCPCEGKVQR